MQAPTFPVTIIADQLVATTSSGPANPLAGGKVLIQMTREDVDTVTGEIIGISPQVLTLDTNGQVIPSLWPNARGARGSQYRVRILDAQGVEQTKAPLLATIPAQACNLALCLTNAPPALSDAQQALNGAQAALATMLNTLQDPGYLAVKADLPVMWALYADIATLNALGADLANLNAVAAALTALNAIYADLAALNALQADQANVDAVAAALASVNACAANLTAILNAPTFAAQAQAAQLGAQAADADAIAQATLTTKLTATAQAAAQLAQSYAASASSVVQQDLSAVNGAALHRSPNPIVCQPFIYDTSKDSDPGWVDRVGETSWMNEQLNGTWLYGPYSGFASEMDARDWFGIGQSPTTGSLITGDSSTFTNGVGSWAIGGSGSFSAVSGRLRLTCSVGGVQPRGSLALTTVVGQRYRVDLTFVTAAAAVNTFIGAGTSSSANDLTNVNMGTAVGSKYFAFVATGVTTYINLQGSVSWTLAQFSEIDNITCTPVSFAANPSGAYYQDATTGKHQRLWQNRAPNSEDLTGSGWTKNATGTASAAVLANVPGAGPNGENATQVSMALNGGTTNVDWVQIVVQNTIPAIAQGLQYSFGFMVKAATPGDVGKTIAYRHVGAASYTLYVLTNSWQFVSAVETAFSTTASPSWALRGNAFTSDSASFLVTRVQLVAGAIISDATYEKKATQDLGQTETFRGNTAKFPRLSAIIAEATNVTIYDLTQPGRPMWMRFLAGSTAYNWWQSAASITCLAILNGELRVGSISTGLRGVNFLRDSFSWVHQSAVGQPAGGIASRNGAVAVSGQSTINLVSGGINAVAMTALPDAPLDPFTLMQVPTIEVLTAGGVSEIKHDGTVVNSALTSAFVSGSITPNGLLAATAAGAVYWAASPGSLGASFAMTQISTSIPGIAYAAPASNTAAIQPKRQMIVKRAAAGAKLSLVYLNEANPAASPEADITDTYNTGLMLNSVRCWLSSNVAESITPTNLVVNGTFGDTSAWSAFGGPFTLDAGAGRITNDGSGGVSPCRLWQNVTTVPGKTYAVSANVTGSSGGSTSIAVGLTGGVSASTGSMQGGSSTTLGAGTAGSLYGWFTATTATSSILLLGGTALNSWADFDNISVQEVDADRSYKNKPLTINGTLAKTLTGGLSMYSGWSATNYAQEAYSADLDPGTGGFYVPITSTIPVGVAAVGWAFDRSAAGGAFYKAGHDATGHLTATAFDGTTTRTVTTTAAYNTGTVFSWAVGLSSSGTLTIYVGGKAVASTAGAPLLTLTNASATCTVGIDRGLTAPWSGSLALVKPGMTIPTLEQASFAYEQEKFLFASGAVATLPDSGAVVDMDYDPMMDRLKVVSAANESSWTGLVQTMANAVTAGSFTKASHRSGIKLLARSTTNPGVDVSIPAYGLREELFNRAYAAAKLARLEEPLDYSGGFTCTTTLNSTALTNVTGWVYPLQVNPRGVPLVAAGIPAGAVVTDVVGSTVYISAPATASASGVAVTTTDLPLPVGYEAKKVSKNGAGLQEGTGKAFTRVFDGFIERPRQVSNPVSSDWLQVSARRTA